MLARKAGLQLGGAQGRTDTRMAVCGNGNANARTADKYTRALFLFNCGAQLVSQHGIIAAVGGIGALVHHINALLGKKLHKVCFQRIARVV